MATSKIERAKVASSATGNTWLEAVDPNDSNRLTRIQTNIDGEYPLFFKTEDRTTWEQSGIVLAHTGILHTEFNLYSNVNLIGLTFWISPARYYRILFGINGNKALFCEYFDGTNTTRIWTATVT